LKIELKIEPKIEPEIEPWIEPKIELKTGASHTVPGLSSGSHFSQFDPGSENNFYPHESLLPIAPSLVQ